MGEPGMKDMCLIYMEENALNEAQRESCYEESAGYARELGDRGKYVAAGPLHPTARAKSVRVREGKAVVTDGPFAETREQLGGYFLIEAENEAEAIAIAARIPGRDGGRWRCGQ